MRLPLIKHIVDFIEENDADFIEETISVLEHLTESSNIKDEEIDVIGELLSNLYGAVEVIKKKLTEEWKEKFLKSKSPI